MTTVPDVYLDMDAQGKSSPLSHNYMCPHDWILGHGMTCVTSEEGNSKKMLLSLPNSYFFSWSRGLEGGCDAVVDRADRSPIWKLAEQKVRLGKTRSSPDLRLTP